MSHFTIHSGPYSMYVYIPLCSMMEQYNTEFEEGEEEEGDEGLSVSPDCHVTTFNPFPTITVVSLQAPRHCT